MIVSFSITYSPKYCNCQIDKARCQTVASCRCQFLSQIYRFSDVNRIRKSMRDADEISPDSSKIRDNRSKNKKKKKNRRDTGDVTSIRRHARRRGATRRDAMCVRFREPLVNFSRARTFVKRNPTSSL